MQSYQIDKMYKFIVTAERNAAGCQIVQDLNGVRHLLTRTDKTYPVGKSVKLVVKGYSHSPSEITGSYYLVLSPKKKVVNPKQIKPYSGKHLTPPKRKKTGFGPLFLKKVYSKGKRYLFVVTDVRDEKGRQFVEDSLGIKHILTGASSIYATGDNVRCTVRDFSENQHPLTENYYLLLSMPRVVNRTKAVPKYVKSPKEWYSIVQGLDKHRSGRPFTCSCCGLDFPGGMGYRIDLNDIYFCNSCARKIFEPQVRRTSPKLIYTPMGNKR